MGVILGRYLYPPFPPPDEKDGMVLLVVIIAAALVVLVVLGVAALFYCKVIRKTEPPVKTPATATTQAVALGTPI